MKSAAWSDPEQWRSLCDGSNCPICLRGCPLDVIADFPTTWVSAGRVAPLPGYVCVVSKRHVVEPFELRPEEQSVFWAEVLTVAGALAALFRPLKMNYEIHGNVVPHLHVHLFPRYAGDPYDTGALRPHDAAFTRSDEELARMRETLQAASSLKRHS
jgi:diadenosine tetraphosphate (Ap4A) HIT family hydrolase